MLESGQGHALRSPDLDAGTVETVAELPGFTRGLPSPGGLAFVGLSQVRETATFGGLPLMERLDERLCGVWVVNLESGADRGLPALRGAGPGGIRRRAAAGRALSGDRRGGLRRGHELVRLPDAEPAVG